MELKVCSNKGPNSLPRGDNHQNKVGSFKNHLKKKKKTTGKKSSNLHWEEELKFT
jgi:hypothetical protein